MIRRTVAEMRPRRGSKGLGGRAGARLRRGAASLDYVLLLGVIMPLVVLTMWAGPRLMRLAYDMIGVLISSPFF